MKTASGSIWSARKYLDKYSNEIPLSRIIRALQQHMKCLWGCAESGGKQKYSSSSPTHLFLHLKPISSLLDSLISRRKAMLALVVPFSI